MHQTNHDRQQPDCPQPDANVGEHRMDQAVGHVRPHRPGPLGFNGTIRLQDKVAQQMSEQEEKNHQ
jgi:hypothetical protein